MPGATVQTQFSPSRSVAGAPLASQWAATSGVNRPAAPSIPHGAASIQAPFHLLTRLAPRRNVGGATK